MDAFEFCSNIFLICGPHFQYDIDKVYQKSISDNHPRESLEASFDIVFDDRTAPAEYFEAECIMVVCEVLRIIRSTIKRDAVTLSDHVHLASPLYCIKLNHTRLTELILDICNVPPKESIRRACVHILTLSACSPFMAMASIEGTKIRPDDKDSIKKDLDVQLANAMTRSGLPEESAKRLRIFLEDCLPLSAKFLEALSAIEGSIKRLHVNDLKQVKDPRRFKKYDEATKSLRSLRSLHSALESLKILPLIDTPNTMTGSDHIHLPIYISIDLGLRPRRKLHGPFVFQAVILPDNDQPNVDTTVVSSKGAIVADGGRYDDLVLRFSPPGNLISAPMVCIYQLLHCHH
jgi:translation initiation factor 2-alpha kinase 4